MNGILSLIKNKKPFNRDLFFKLLENPYVYTKSFVAQYLVFEIIKNNKLFNIPADKIKEIFVGFGYNRIFDFKNIKYQKNNFNILLLLLIEKNFNDLGFSAKDLFEIMKKTNLNFYDNVKFSPLMYFLSLGDKTSGFTPEMIKDLAYLSVDEKNNLYLTDFMRMLVVFNKNFKLSRDVIFPLLQKCDLNYSRKDGDSLLWLLLHFNKRNEINLTGEDFQILWEQFDIKKHVDCKQSCLSLILSNNKSEGLFFSPEQIMCLAEKTKFFTDEDGVDPLWYVLQNNKYEDLNLSKEQIMYFVGKSSRTSISKQNGVNDLMLLAMNNSDQNLNFTPDEIVDFFKKSKLCFKKNIVDYSSIYYVLANNKNQKLNLSRNHLFSIMNNIDFFKKIYTNINPGSGYFSTTYFSLCLDLNVDQNLGFTNDNFLGLLFEGGMQNNKMDGVVALMSKNKSLNLSHDIFVNLLDIKNQGSHFPLSALIMYNEDQSLGFSKGEICEYIKEFPFKKNPLMYDYVVVGMLSNYFDFTREMFFVFFENSYFLLKDDPENIFSYNSKVDLLLNYYLSIGVDPQVLDKKDLLYVMNKINLESKSLDETHRKKIESILEYSKADNTLPLSSKSRLNELKL